jgi:hypothetical protein
MARGAHTRTACICRFLVLLLTATPAAAQVEFGGTWQQMAMDWRGTEPLQGDYTGLPLNEAARLRGDSFNTAKWTVPEHQCEPHPIDYALFGPAHLRVWTEVDPITQEAVAIKQSLHWMVQERTIWLDGRPHPSEFAPRTWMGFSTGRWEADTLVVTTTHMKEGWLRRNGLPRSEQGKLTEYWTRHDNYLTVVQVLEDPGYLSEPLVRSQSWMLDPGYSHQPYPCSARAETERPPGYVAHFLPGQNEVLEEVRESLGLPLEALEGGARTTTPDFARQLRELALQRLDRSQSEGGR